jgi:hypothetical protein
MDNKAERKELEEKLKALDAKIKDVEDRLPAHGIKPPIMTQLFELEDEREAIQKQLDALKDTESND